MNELEPLIDAERVAQHLGYSTRQVVERISKQPGFPKPLVKKPLKWLLTDINEWMRKATSK